MKIFTNHEINSQQPKETIEVFIDKFEDARKSGNTYYLRGNKKGKDINYLVAFSADGNTSDYIIDIHGLKLHNNVPNEPVVLKGFTTYEGAKEFVKDYFKNEKTAYKTIKGSYEMAKASLCIVYVEKQEAIAEEQYNQRLAF